MKSFRIREYPVRSRKLPAGHTMTFALVSDLHGFEYGRHNAALLQAIDVYAPDAVLAAGDMQVRGNRRSLAVAQDFLCRLARNYPVYYAAGNHEVQMGIRPKETENFARYERILAKNGVHFLHNASKKESIRGNLVRFWGLEIPLRHYKKPFSPDFTTEHMRKLLGEPDPEAFNVVLAHNPKYGDAYFSWGGDLIVSGHYHGGVLRFTEHVGALSPQLRPFPKYCCGDFHRGDQCLIVSGGLGEHTVPVRIHDPHELIILRVTGTANQKKESKSNGH